MAINLDVHELLVFGDLSCSFDKLKANEKLETLRSYRINNVYKISSKGSSPLNLDIFQGFTMSWVMLWPP